MPKAPEPSSTCQKTTKSLPRISPKSYCYNAVPNRFSLRFSTSRTNGPRLLSRVKADTLAFANRIAHNGTHAETGGVSDGGGITTLRAFRTFTNIPGPGIRTASFAAFGSWSETLLKNAESLRSSDALMRVAVPRRRGPAGLRDLFRFCRNRSLYALRSGPFRVCEARGGITTLSALYVLLKRRSAACQSG